MIAENLSTSVVQELSSLTKQLKDDRRKVSSFQFRFFSCWKTPTRNHPYITSAKNWMGVWVVGLEEITALSAQMAQNIGNLAEAPSVLFSVNYTDAKQK
mgnify:CR=1 FL=1